MSIGNDSAQELYAIGAGGEIFAGGGNDQLFGNRGNDILHGEQGDDQLYGGGGDDILQGGAGNDYLVGGEGSDTYIFNRGDGQDIISDQGNTGNNFIGRVPVNDTLQFGTDISSQDIDVSSSGDDFLLFIRGTNNKVLIENYLANDQAYLIEQILFADGTIWVPEDILNHVVDGIPLPRVSDADVPISTNLMRQQISLFLAMDDGDDSGCVGAPLSLASASNSAVQWQQSVGY